MGLDMTLGKEKQGHQKNEQINGVFLLEKSVEDSVSVSR